MSRLTYAGKQLESQLRAKYPDAEISYGEPDGLDVIREMTFDKASSKWLWATFRDNLDARFASGEMKRGILTLIVQGRSPLADDKTPFDLPTTPAVEAPETSAGTEVDTADSPSPSESAVDENAPS